MEPKIYGQSESLMIKAAVLRYVKGYSQLEISDILGISPPTVSRLIKKVNNKNLIKYVLDDRLVEISKLEENLKDKFELDEVIVVRGLDEDIESLDNEEVRKLVALEGAQYVQRVINDDDILGLAISRTLYYMINYFNPCKKTDTQFITFHGDTVEIDKKLNVDKLIKTMAMSFGGKHYAIKGPAIADSIDNANKFKNLEENKEVFEKFKNVNICVCGVGSSYPNNDSILHSNDYYSEEQLDEINNNEVYADISMRLLDVNGKECDTLLKERTVGIELDQLKSIPTKIIITSGENKKYSLRSVIRGGFADVIIIDYKLAKAMMKIDK